MFHPFYPLPFSPLVCPHTEFNGSPEHSSWNVLYQTSLRNYASFSLQVPSILSILLGCHTGPPGYIGRYDKAMLESTTVYLTGTMKFGYCAMCLLPYTIHVKNSGNGTRNMYCGSPPSPPFYSYIFCKYVGKCSPRSRVTFRSKGSDKSLKA
jgi:hypothetical protein